MKLGTLKNINSLSWSSKVYNSKTYQRNIHMQDANITDCIFRNKALYNVISHLESRPVLSNRRPQGQMWP